MNNQNKMFAAILIIIGLVNLLRREWIDLGIFTAIGVSLLIDSKKLEDGEDYANSVDDARGCSADCQTGYRFFS